MAWEHKNYSGMKASTAASAASPAPLQVADASNIAALKNAPGTFVGFVDDGLAAYQTDRGNCVGRPVVTDAGGKQSIASSPWSTRPLTRCPGM